MLSDSLLSLNAICNVQFLYGNNMVYNFILSFVYNSEAYACMSCAP